MGRAIVQDDPVAFHQIVRDDHLPWIRVPFAHSVLLNNINSIALAVQSPMFTSSPRTIERRGILCHSCSCFPFALQRSKPFPRDALFNTMPLQLLSLTLELFPTVLLSYHVPTDKIILSLARLP